MHRRARTAPATWTPRAAPWTTRAAVAFALMATLAALVTSVHGSAAKPIPLSIKIVANHFVNGAGRTIRLLGVDRSGAEWACINGPGYTDGEDARDADLIASWKVTAVRLALNEDCWLGLNGEPRHGTEGGYRSAVESYVKELNEHGIYVILDLHWTAPGANVADGQRPMPDEHSVAFWKSVAGTFKQNPAVLFDVFNEPMSPAARWADESAYPVSWKCWRDGGCLVTAGNVGAGGGDGDPGADPPTYRAVGMQTLVDAIRSVGAPQPIMIGGLNFASDLTGWLAHEPNDPGPHGHRTHSPQLAASFHNYQAGSENTLAKWNAMLGPIIKRVPVVTGEFGETPCSATSGKFVHSTRWDQTFMRWADRHGVSYLGWGWYHDTTPTCTSYSLLSSDAKPFAPNGTALHAHLAALFASAKATSTRSA